MRKKPLKAGQTQLHEDKPINNIKSIAHVFGCVENYKWGNYLFYKKIHESSL